MLKLVKTERDRVIEELKKRNALLPCAACGNNQFTTYPERSQVIIGKNQRAYDWTRIPAAVIICVGCGYIRFHALGVLDLL